MVKSPFLRGGSFVLELKASDSIAYYIIEHKTMVRQTAKKSEVSKNIIHIDVTKGHFCEGCL